MSASRSPLTSTRIGFILMTGGVALFVFLSALGFPPGKADTASAAAKRTVIAKGHVDAVSARIIGNRLRFQLKDGTGAQPVWRKPGSVLIKVRPRASLKLPEGMGFVGPEGKRVWMIPQVERRGIVWAGWNTEEVSSSQIRGGVNYALTKVRGPGKVVIFQTGSFGDHDVLFNSGRRLPQRMSVPTGTHAHANWAFTAKGTYKMSFRLSARSAMGKAMSDKGVLTIKVG
jgi:putative ABC transporter-associated repeat protein